jgi:hypothetical protein
MLIELVILLQVTDKAVAVGFGVSTPEQVKQVIMPSNSLLSKISYFTLHSLYKL